MIPFVPIVPNINNWNFITAIYYRNPVSQNVTAFQRAFLYGFNESNVVSLPAVDNNTNNEVLNFIFSAMAYLYAYTFTGPISQMRSFLNVFKFSKE